MPVNIGRRMRHFRSSLRTALSGPHLLAFLPAITLAGYWFLGEGALIVLTLGMPLAFALAGLFTPEGSPASPRGERDAVTDLPLRRAAVEAAEQHLAVSPGQTPKSAVMALRVDHYAKLGDTVGHHGRDQLLVAAVGRIRSLLRKDDLVARSDEDTFIITLSPTPRTDLESLVQLANRLQSACDEAFSLDATRLYMSTSIGFCPPGRVPGKSGEAFVEAAELALSEAILQGGGAVRAFAKDMWDKALQHSMLSDQAASALENDQIRPWFQPQVSTETGQITGIEALARWDHPERGTLLPAEFVNKLIDGGLSERLGEVIMYHTFDALRDWDQQGLGIQTVSINFSGEELRNPKLIEKIRWELDRFDLTPARLAIEVLETVIATLDSDIVLRNLRGLSEMGCRIDLDDFGTGHASIANIRRFSVDRIKIDQSFIRCVDTDPEQQSMVAAILTMSERLKLDTLAEGVETLGEYAALSQLGCGHVQGNAVSKVLPRTEVADWVRTHREKLTMVGGASIAHLGARGASR